MARNLFHAMIADEIPTGRCWVCNAELLPRQTFWCGLGCAAKHCVGGVVSRPFHRGKKKPEHLPAAQEKGRRSQVETAKYDRKQPKRRKKAA